MLIGKNIVNFVRRVAMNDFWKTRMSQKSKRKKGSIYETLDVRGVGGTMISVDAVAARIMDSCGVDKWTTIDCIKQITMTLAGLAPQVSGLQFEGQAYRSVKQRQRNLWLSSQQARFVKGEFRAMGLFQVEAGKIIVGRWI